MRPETGEFKVDESELVINADLTAAQFEAANIPISTSRFSEKTGGKSFRFNATIDGMRADFSSYFRNGNLYHVSWVPSQEVKHLWPKSEHLVKWIIAVSGVNPPYNYEWGYIDTEPDEKSGVLGVSVFYKRHLESRGITDIWAYYAGREAYYGR